MKKRRNRQATEDTILDAFERIVTRDGIAAVNPTRVMEEAGFSKPLLYDYFGNLVGLATEWTLRRPIWPNYDFPDDPADGDFRQHLERFLLATAKNLHDNPVALELLHAELGQPNDIVAAMETSRQVWLQENMASVLAHPEINEPDNWNLMFVFYAAISYLALRSRRDVAYAGMRLDTEAGWRDAMDRVEQVMEDFVLLGRLKQIAKEGRRSLLAELLDALEEG